MAQTTHEIDMGQTGSNDLINFHTRRFWVHSPSGEFIVTFEASSLMEIKRRVRLAVKEIHQAAVNGTGLDVLIPVKISHEENRNWATAQVPVVPIEELPPHLKELVAATA